MRAGLTIPMLQTKKFKSTFIVHTETAEMKFTRLLVALFIFTFTFSSCSMWNRVFPPKYGCETNGKNVGAEKLLDGSKQPKAKKFKA